MKALRMRLFFRMIGFLFFYACISTFVFANDSDGDGLSDSDELLIGLDPSVANTSLMNFFSSRENTARIEGNASGVAYAQVNRLSFDLYLESEKNVSDAASHALGLTDGNVSGVAYVQANYSSYNLYTESEKNASDDGNYSLGFSDGNASAWASALADWNATEGNQTEVEFALFAEAWNRGIASGKEEIKLKMAREALSIVSHYSSVENHSLYTGDWYYQNELGWLWSTESVFPFFFRAAAKNGENGTWLFFSHLPDQQGPAFFDYHSAEWIYLRE
jgi:hypothetical protein